MLDRVATRHPLLAAVARRELAGMLRMPPFIGDSVAVLGESEDRCQRKSTLVTGQFPIEQCRDPIANAAHVIPA